MNISKPAPHVAEKPATLSDAWRLSWTGQLAQALTIATTLAAEALQRGDAQAQAEAVLLTAECNLHLGRIDQAHTQAHTAARLFKDLASPAEESRARALTAWILITRADADLALDEALAALDLAMGSADTLAQAFAHDVAGIVYWLIQQPAKAISFLEDAIRLARAGGDNVQLGRYLINLGGAQAQKGALAAQAGDAPQAAHWTRIGIATAAEGLAVSTAAGDIWAMRIALCNMAEQHSGLGDHVAAQHCLAQHNAIPGGLDTRARVHLQFTSGILAAAQGLYDHAITHFQNSLSAEQDGDMEQAVTSLSHLAAAYESAGRFPEALAAYKKYHALQTKMAEAAVQRRARYAALRLENDKLRALASAERRRAQTLESKNDLLAREAERLSRAMLEDDLTKLSNRRHLEVALFELLVSGERYAIAMLDIDHFKQINDNFSHATGDAILRQIGALLRQCCRAQDLAVRYGGEEFTILMRGTDQLDARKICDRLKSVIEDHDWRALLPGARVTISIGAAAWPEATSPTSVLALADWRLYRAKAEGRSRVVDKGLPATAFGRSVREKREGEA